MSYMLKFISPDAKPSEKLFDLIMQGEIMHLNSLDQIQRIKDTKDKSKILSPLQFKILRYMLKNGYSTNKICKKLSVNPAVIYRENQKTMQAFGSKTMANVAYILGASNLV
ncbi:MAG: hypothetical protein HY840_10880 [Bacteroidetes bacterium]|nr:hypothetical protein [Bacteroidota bacterium]